jgi:hypothetical protein
MQITKLDVAQMKNLINALEGAKYPELNGKNVIALARCFEWLAIFNNRMNKDQEEAEALASVEITDSAVEESSESVDGTQESTKIT